MTIIFHPFIQDKILKLDSINSVNYREDSEMVPLMLCKNINTIITIMKQYIVFWLREIERSKSLKKKKFTLKILRYSKEPLFVTKPLSTEAIEGDTVIISCEVVGDPKPEVMWLRDFLRVRSLIFIFVTRTIHASNLHDVAFIYLLSQN